MVFSTLRMIYNGVETVQWREKELCCREDHMPEVSLFMGIRITMYYDDHNLPHFHAEYAGKKAIVNIADCCVMRGSLPNRQLKFVLAWAELHKDELMQNWELAASDRPLSPIAPLM